MSAVYARGPAAAAQNRATPVERIAVIGLGVSGLSKRARRRLSDARVVVGNPRQLRAHAPPGARLIPLAGDWDEVLDQLAEAPGPAAILDAGDPGFFGMVGELAQRFGRQRLEVIPAVSAVALAFARVGLPWDDALVVSARGRGAFRAVNAAFAHPKVAMLTGGGAGPGELARALRGSGRLLVVAEHLGEPAERVTEGTPEELAGHRFAEPNLLLVLDVERAVASKCSLWPPHEPLGGAAIEPAELDESGSSASGVQALVLDYLAPRLGDLVWSIGSGSAAVDCARRRSAVIAVDSDSEACALVKADARVRGVELLAVRGRAPEVLEHLPRPDAAVVAVVGEDLPRILDACAACVRRTVVVVVRPVDSAELAAARLAAAGLRVESALVQAAQIKPEGDVHRLVPCDPVFVMAGRRA